MDATMLSRIQFYLTAAYHFLFVPLTVGIGLILAINETRYYHTRKPSDEAATKFWVKIFTATFVIGVATGITMEFSFGTNWADYARYVGDIFGAPLAAEALIAFFLESVFLGVLLFGRNRVSPKFYLVSTWLVWIGSCLSALWIIIANSWMQTPAGAEVGEDGNAVLTDFFAAAFNSSTLPRYSHVVVALIIMGAFVAMSVSAYYLIKGRHQDFAMKTLKIGTIVGIIATCAMLVTAHSTAVEVSEEQPTKFAMMEGMYEDEVPPLYLFGWVDEDSHEVITLLSIPGGTSFLATGTWDTEFEGLYTLAETEEYGDIDIDELPVNLVFQSYHLMVIMFGLIAITVFLVLFFTYRGGKIKHMKWLQYLALISPLFPFIAIQSGWITAEVGRQPWLVYPATSSPDGIALLTVDGVSASLSTTELVISIVLFVVVYLVLLIAWIRVVARIIKEGPEEGLVPVDGDKSDDDSDALKTAPAAAVAAAAAMGVGPAGAATATATAGAGAGAGATAAGADASPRKEGE